MKRLFIGGLLTLLAVIGLACTPSEPSPTSKPEGALSKPAADIPAFLATRCPGTDVDPHLVKMTPALIDCLIDAGKTSHDLTLIYGATLDPVISQRVIQAWEEGVKLLGNWGPLVVTMVQIDDPNAADIAARQCAIRDYYTPQGRSADECTAEAIEFYSGFDCCGAVHDPPEPLAPVRVQYVTFSAPEEQSRDNQLRKVFLHEYVHVYQNAQIVHPHELRYDGGGGEDMIAKYGFGPIWIEEGAAEYLALDFANDLGWLDKQPLMVEALDAAREVRTKGGLSLRDVETRSGQAWVNDLCDCGGQLYYETGQVAIAWLTNRVGRDELIRYYSLVAYKHWKDAFNDVFGLVFEQFYDEFDAFLDLRRDQQLNILKMSTAVTARTPTISVKE